MRVRQASIAVSSSSGARSTSALTGFGELMITSCAPIAGRDVNSSGIPRPERIGSSLAAASMSPVWRGVTPPSAGKRFGTARTRQPGVLGAPPPGRSAHTSGGVRSSLPSANGSFSGSIGGRSSIFELKAPGRDARSPATIARRPVSGSSRSSGKRLLHRHVWDALVHELFAACLEATALVEGARRELRMQADPPRARRPRLLLGGAQDCRTDPAPAHVVADGHPAQERQVVLEHKPARADNAPALDRHDVRRDGVEAVAVGLKSHALLPDEHAPA